MFKTSNTTVPSQRFSQAMSFEIPVSTTDSLERANQWVEAANGEKLKKNGISKEWLKTTIQKMGPTTALETFDNLPVESPAIAYYVKNGRSPETLAVMAKCRELHGEKDGANRYINSEIDLVNMRKNTSIFTATVLTIAGFAIHRALGAIALLTGICAVAFFHRKDKEKIALWEAHRTRRNEYYDQKIQTATSK